MFAICEKIIKTIPLRERSNKSGGVEDVNKKL